MERAAKVVKCRKERSKNFTRQEIITMTEFVKQYRQQLFGRAGHCSTKVEKRKQKCWKKLADVLRASGGPQQREWTEIKKKWQELKSNANKYNVQRTSGTGGGPQAAYNEMYEIVLSALEPEIKDGFAGIGSEAGVASMDEASSQDYLSQETLVSNPAVNAYGAGDGVKTAFSEAALPCEHAAEHEEQQAHRPSHYSADYSFRLLEVEKEKVAVMKDLLEVGNYFFDDSLDSDSDNVQWIAAYNIDDFICSSLWNVTRKVAKYVSGKDDWFPYDIACNVIRAYDHTRIHEDCEKQEDEWTFLLYLTPNWTENYYGETVFRETNSDDSEYIVGVLPRYGRVVIFQGIIPHSARPPSTFFQGARLSFAVKLSINPWVARVKMMKQEFTHEESMHHMVFSLLKYYNDANFEARHKEELLHSVQESMREEQEQRLRYLKALREMHFHGNHQDDAEDAEIDDFVESDEEFEFVDFYPHDEDDFPEIVERKNYIYGLFKSLNRDVDALTVHYKQFLKDREVMKQRYAKELARLF